MESLVKAMDWILERVTSTHWVTGSYESDRCHVLTKTGKKKMKNGQPVFKIGWCEVGLINKSCELPAGSLESDALLGRRKQTLSSVLSYMREEIADNRNWDDNSPIVLPPNEEVEARIERAKKIGTLVWQAVKQHPTYVAEDHNSIEDWNDDGKRRREHVIEVNQEVRNILAIRERGHIDGIAATTWIVDGNTNDPVGYLSKLVKGMEDGDPEVMDSLPSPRLGGEFADDPTWAMVLRDETGIVDEDRDDLYEEYNNSFSQAVESEIHRMLGVFSDPAETEIGKEQGDDTEPN